MASDFYSKVYAIVRRIPRGKVTTYGLIAEAIGARSSARTVGFALNACPDPLGTPCHRVVNRFGALTGRIHFGDLDLMRSLLEQEGVTFDGDCVALERHLWKPRASSRH